MPDAASIRRTFGLARVAVGAGMALLPGLTGRLWWAQAEVPPTTTVVLRGFGARDALIGAGTALAGPAAAGGWLRAGIAADAADAIAALLAGGRLPTSRRLATAAFGAFGALTGLAIERASRAARDGSGGAAG